MLTQRRDGTICVCCVSACRLRSAPRACSMPRAPQRRMSGVFVHHRPSSRRSVSSRRSRSASSRPSLAERSPSQDRGQQRLALSLLATGLDKTPAASASQRLPPFMPLRLLLPRAEGDGRALPCCGSGSPSRFRARTRVARPRGRRTSRGATLHIRCEASAARPRARSSSPCASAVCTLLRIRDPPRPSRSLAQAVAWVAATLNVSARRKRLATVPAAARLVLASR